MTSATPCATTTSTSTIAERPRYYPRQLITSDDLMLEQEYFRNRMRRHNRLMHGWGVVCGAKVCPAPAQSSGSSGATNSFDPWHVVVTPGYVLGPYGDEILLDCCRTIDLRTPGASGVTGDPCVQAVDPWCSDVFVVRDPSMPLYVAVKYKECKTRPVRVQPIGCGCDDTLCEYSRLQDGYEIGILTVCPDGNTTAPDIKDMATGGVPACPPCPSLPWVVLAQVQASADGTIVVIDNCQCRRTVQSYGAFWWQCHSGAVTISSVTGADKSATALPVAQGASGSLLVTLNVDSVNGQTPAITVDLGPGVKVNPFTQPGADGKLTLTFDVLPTAAAGLYALTVTASSGSMAVYEDAVEVTPKSN